MLENLRLRELIAIVRANQAFYDEFVDYLKSQGYADVSEFISEPSDEKALEIITAYLRSSSGSELYNGLKRPYSPSKARWYFLAWLLRDAPAQRLEPLLKDVPGDSPVDRKAHLLNEVRKFVSPLLPEAEHWTWPVISEVMLARLEGSRRAIKGMGFQKIIRQCLRDFFEKHKIELDVSDKELRIDNETYDVVIKGKVSSILMPVKTRETMGGGHAHLFTRDIERPIRVAKGHNYNCIPVIIAELWSGNLESLETAHYIYIQANPNQVELVIAELREELEKLVGVFKELGSAI